MADYKLYCDDCRNVIPALDMVDHVITDVPYSDVTHKGACTNLGHHGKDRAMLIGKLLKFDAIGFVDLRHILEMTGEKTRCWTISFMDWRHIALLEVNTPESLRFVRFGLFVKPNSAPQFTGDRPSTGWEGIAMLHRAGVKLAWNGKGRSSVFTYPIVHQAHAHSDNPTEKPLALMEELITLFTNPGDLILDPFMGSGTTGEAAMRTGRRFIGVEIDQECFDVAERRIQYAAMQPPMSFTIPLPATAQLAIFG